MSEMNPLAFSTIACPDWNVDQVISAAQQYGYEGVELRTMGAGSTSLASDPAGANADVAAIRSKFEKAEVKLTCLATGVALHYREEYERLEAIKAAKQSVDLAAELGCQSVRMFGYQIYPGELKTKAMKRISERFLQIGEYAEESGVEVLIENGGTFARSKELWKLMQAIDHPLVGVYWNVADAAAVGEGPGISVTVLNSKIRGMKVKDLEVGEGTGFLPLGEGTVQVERFIESMRGIGYNDFITFEWDKAWLPSLADAEVALPLASATMREWMRIKVDKKGKPLSRWEAGALEVKA